VFCLVVDSVEIGSGSVLQGYHSGNGKEGNGIKSGQSAYICFICICLDSDVDAVWVNSVNLEPKVCVRQLRLAESFFLKNAISVCFAVCIVYRFVLLIMLKFVLIYSGIPFIVTNNLFFYPGKSICVELISIWRVDCTLIRNFFYKLMICMCGY
jgi:hypothetical protein